MVDVVDVEESLARFGDAYLSRVYTTREIAACSNGTRPRRLAAIFAAKEAALKALSAPDEPFDWRSIEIVPTADGVAVSLTAEGAAFADRLGVRHLDVSTTATPTYASAIAIVEVTQA